MDDELKKLVRLNDSALAGRQTIFTFKKGGPVDKQQVYDSARRNLETQTVIHNLLFLLGTTKLSPSIVGKSFKAFAPWEQPETDDIEELASRASETITYARQMRVAEMVEQPNGVILVHIESF